MFDNQRSDSALDQRDSGCFGGASAGRGDHPGGRMAGLRAGVLAGLTIGAMAAGSIAAVGGLTMTITPPGPIV